jgi:hypothetical protein
MPDASLADMERKQLTCPETGHLEEIDFERTSSGLVVSGCSRFEPRSAVRCPGECARRMDRRDRLGAADRSERVLVGYTDDDADDGGTRLIAEVIANYLRCDGVTAELANLATAPPAADYDAVVIGSSVHHGRPARAALAFIEEHRAMLVEMPTFWFSVGSATSPHEPLTHATTWCPTDRAWFASPDHAAHSLPELVASIVHHRTPATDWSAVRTFALRIAEQVPSSELQPTMT